MRIGASESLQPCQFQILVSEVLAFSPGDAMDRRARVLLLDRATGQGSDLVVSVTEGRVVSQVSIDSTADGHVPILDQEFEDIESFLLDCPEWIEAMAKRKLNPTDVRAVPLSAGVFGHEDEVGAKSRVVYWAAWLKP